MFEIFPGQYKGLAEALSVLRKVDEDSFKALKRDMKKQAHPHIAAIKQRIQNAESQLRAAGATTGNPAGVFSNSRTGWGGASVKFSVTSRKYPRAVLAFESTGTKGRYGYDLIEKAGTQGYNSAQGKAFIAMLNSRLEQKGATRMAYPVLVKQLPQIRRDMQFILEAYQDKISAALER
jgi:hypothetical protein